MRLSILKVFTQFTAIYIFAMSALALGSSERFGGCSQKMQVVEGIPRCSCMEGFVLTNNYSCVPKDPVLRIIYTFGCEVMSIKSDSSRSPVSISSGHPNSVTTDIIQNAIYWTDAAEKNGLVNKETRNDALENVVTAGISHPNGIAFDWMTGNIYFVDYDFGFIAACAQNPTQCAVVVQENETSPNGIALHPNQGIMFWTKPFNSSKGVLASSAVIQRAEMDGSEPKTIVSTTGLIWPNSITLDEGNSRIYWVSGLGNKIESSGLDGSDRNFITVSEPPFGIDILGDKIFWIAAETTKHIMSANKFTGQSETRIVTNSNCSSGVASYGLSLMHSTKQPKLRANPCPVLKCSHICTLSGASAQCLCPAGFIKHGNTCLDDEKKPKLLLAQGNMLFAMRVNTIGRNVYEHIPLASQIQEISALVYNPVGKTLLISDSMSFNIVEYNLQGEVYTVLVENVNATALEIDLIGENLIWVNGDDDTIEVLSLRTLARTVVHQHMDNSHDIAFSPHHGTLYLSKTGDAGDEEIYKIILDNKSNDYLFHTCTGCMAPVKLTYDQETDGVIASLFDGTRVTIRSESTDGTQFNQLTTSFSIDPVVGVVEIENQIFLVDQTSDVTVITTKEDDDYRHLFYHRIHIYNSSNDSSGFVKVLASMNPSMTEHHSERLEQHECSPKNPNMKACSQICLPTGSDMTGVCWCGAGFRLDEDGETCIEDDTPVPAFDGGGIRNKGGSNFGIYVLLAFVCVGGSYVAYSSLTTGSNPQLPKPRILSNSI